MGSLEDRILASVKNSDVIDIMDPKNQQIVEELNDLVERNLLMLSSVSTVPSVAAEGWEPLVQHASFMLGISLRSRDTECKIMMDSRGRIDVIIKRGDKLLQQVEIDPEPDSKLDTS